MCVMRRSHDLGGTLTCLPVPVPTHRYWRYEGLRAVMSAERMIEFTVLDCTPVVVTTKASTSRGGRKRRGRKKGRGVKRMSPSDSGEEEEDFDDNTSVMASTAKVTNTGFGGAFGKGVGAGLGGMDRCVLMLDVCSLQLVTRPPPDLTVRLVTSPGSRSASLAACQ